MNIVLVNSNLGAPPYDPLLTTIYTWAAWAGDPLWSHPVDGAVVSAWRDGSGHGHTPAQATGGVQPIYRAASASLNGQPSIDFDGTDDKLDIPAFTGPAQPFTLVAVFYDKTAAKTARIIDSTTNDSHRSLMGLDSTDHAALFAGSTVTTTGTLTRPGIFYQRSYFNGASSTTTINEGAVTVTGNAGTNDLALVRIGNGVTDAGAASILLGFVAQFPGDLSADPSFAAHKAWVNSTYGLSI